MLAGLKRILKNIKSGTCKVRAAEITDIDFVDISFGGSATAFPAFFLRLKILAASGLSWLLLLAVEKK
ncbi:MAG: hypothetical protein ACJASG_001896 [Oleiphilaceae bacterium]|jgi:hypothetical protein